MNVDNYEQHLSRISTLWTLIHKAHHGGHDQATTAQEKLLQRYSGAVHRYLLGALRDENAADDLFQEFSLRFLRGDFKRADPDTGRFRSYLKTALFNLITDHQRRKKKQPGKLEMDQADPADSPARLNESELAFLESWRLEIMDRAWHDLREMDRQTGQFKYLVLRFRADHPKIPSAEMASQIGAQLGKTVSVDWIRQNLHRAREKFTQLLLNEVAQSLDHPNREVLEQELIDLGLLAYCKSSLERWQQ